MDTHIMIGLVAFVASTVVRVAGFGNALISMPFFTPLLGIHIASPLMTLNAAIDFTLGILQSRRQIALSEVWPMMAAMTVTVPAGIYLTYIVPEALLIFLLGIVCFGYGVYRLVKLPLPQLKNRGWAVGAGGLSGVLIGAFNAGGPPVVVYADTQNWEPNKFRTNLFSFFFCTVIATFIWRGLAGQFTMEVVNYWLWLIPFVLLGQLCGFFLVRWIDVELFRKLVLGLLMLIGIRLMGGGVVVM